MYRLLPARHRAISLTLAIPGALALAPLRSAEARVPGQGTPPLPRDTSHAAAATARPTEADSTPTLVVLVAVDQLRADYLTRFAPQFTGGLARLLRGGAVFTNAAQDYAITVTGPGHASMLSGRFPASTGIATNALGVGDPQAPLVGGGGPGASPYRFRGTTLADWLRTADSRSRALSISRKDRGAILPLGRAHQEAYWYARDGRFTTSTYYHDTLPSWVQRFNGRRLPAWMAGRVWTPLRPDSAYREPDSVAAESGGEQVAFPHALPADTAAAVAELPEFPWMDDITLAAALEGVTALGLGAGPAPDLLVVSLSSTDAVGHRYGPDSKELHDQVLRVDRALGIFLDSLYRLRDSSRVVVALTADHGVAPLPGVRSADANARSRFLSPATLLAPERAVLRARGLPERTVRWDGGLVTVERAALRQAGLDPDSLVRALARRLRATPGIARAETPAELARRDTTTDVIARRWRHSIPLALPDLALLVTAKPYVVLTGGPSATHGSPYDYDARVPLILAGAGIRPGRYPAPVRTADLAPTLARVVGVRPTERLDGRVLVQALRGGPRK